MKYTRITLLLACLCNPDVRAPAEEVRYWTTKAADEVACQGQLNIIYGALQQYQKQNRSLPLWLSDLVPDYIHDANTLVCPFVLSTGNIKKWREHARLGGVFDDPGSCSYSYEFRTSQARWTTRDYKHRQMELFGFSVPIVRCLAHQPSLNLAFDGGIYRNPKSGNHEGEWEDIFVISTNHAAVFHNPRLLTNISGNKLVFKLSGLRKPETDARMLDLSGQYNALLFHLSQVDHAGKLLVTYPEGMQRIGGIDFDVRGLIHLNARQFPVAFPEKVENIPVDRKCASIHFLHGATFTAPNGTKVGSFILHFADGRRTEIPLIYVNDVRARWFDHTPESDLETPKPAWTTPPDKVGTSGKSLRLYETTWKNNHQDAEVASVDFISAMTESAPFLLAITAE